MCEMQVRPGQSSAVIAMACAHNVRTVESDMDFFRPLLDARGDHAACANIDKARAHLNAAYREFLLVYARELRAHQHEDGPIGNERSPEPKPIDAGIIADVEKLMARDAHLAKRYETR